MDVEESEVISALDLFVAGIIGVLSLISLVDVLFRVQPRWLMRWRRRRR